MYLYHDRGSLSLPETDLYTFNIPDHGLRPSVTLVLCMLSEMDTHPSVKSLMIHCNWVYLVQAIHQWAYRGLVRLSSV